MSKRKFLLVLCIGICTCLHAQTSHKNIEGVVIDKNGNHIPFVNISLNRSSVGAISNFEGQFEIHISKSDLDVTDTLVFSHIGYATKKLSVGSIKNNQLEVILSENTVTLSEVKIKPINVDSLLYLAVHNRRNFPKKFQLSRASYNYLSKRDGNHALYFIADLDIYADGYLKKKGDKVSSRLLNYELYKNKDIRASFAPPKSLIDFSLVDHNSIISRIPNNDYAYDGIVDKDSSSYLKVDFSNLTETDSSWIKETGNLFINEADSSITYIEITTTYQNIIYKKKMLGVSFEPLEYITKVYFEKDKRNDSYYAKWIIRTSKLYVSNKDIRDLREDFLYLYVTERVLDPAIKKLPKQDKMKRILFNEKGENINGKIKYLDDLMKGSDLPSFISDQ